MQTSRLWRYNHLSTAGGILLFFTILALGRSSPDRIAELILLFHILVLTPIALPLVLFPDRNDRPGAVFGFALLLYPFAAGCGALCLLSPAGETSAFLSLPWLGFTITLSAYGARRYLSRSRCEQPRHTELCFEAGLFYFPVGALWLYFDRAGIHPMGFPEYIVRLTAIHFHHAGFIAPLLAGLTGRTLKDQRSRRLFRFVSPVILAGPLTVALGIAFSPVLESVAGFIFASSLCMLALMQWKEIPAIQKISARWLLGLSACGVLAAMALAVIYIAGGIVNRVFVSVPLMALTHGMLNSFFFCLCGLLSFRILAPAPRLGPSGLPLSRLSSRGPVGPDFFSRRGLVDESGSCAGMIDSLEQYARADFHPAELDPAVRDFYEKTSRYELIVIGHWKRGFRNAARMYKHLSAWMQQMNFPSTDSSHEDMMDSRIVPLRSDTDGRSGVRAWIRTFARSGRALYAAAYSSHTMRSERYMNIAFPYIGGNLTSILRLEAIPTRDGKRGLFLTTLPGERDPGDEGIYFVTRLLPFRLPMNESIYVWNKNDPPEDERIRLLSEDEALISRSQLVARHEMTLFGIRFLSLDYYIFLK